MFPQLVSELRIPTSLPGREGLLLGIPGVVPRSRALASFPASLRDDEGNIACKEQALVTAREEELKFGSSGKFMSGERLSSIFLAQRRGGAEKTATAPYNFPDHSR